MALSEIAAYPPDLLNLVAHDPVHQQEGHLWPLPQEDRRVPAPQCRSNLWQIHKHVGRALLGYDNVNMTGVQEVSGQVISQTQPWWVPAECLLQADQGAQWHNRFGLPRAIALFINPLNINPTNLLPLSVKVLNTRIRKETTNSLLTPKLTSKLIRDHYVKLIHRLALREVMDLPPFL